MSCTPNPAERNLGHPLTGRQGNGKPVTIIATEPMLLY